MKAVQINAYGGNEVVKIDNDVSVPPLSQGEILVKIKAAGINPVDWKIREGFLHQRMPLRFPSTLGGDFSGEVDKIGEGVSGFSKGDQVYGSALIMRGGSGAFAEFAVAAAKAIAHKPKSLNDIEAAALPLIGSSAWQALVEHMHLSSGQKILIHGGAGGIGSIAIQLAKHLGSYVATTAAAEDMPYVKELGADKTIDYKKQSFEDLLNDYDAAFDTIGGQIYEKSFKILKKGGIIVSMLEQPRSDLMEQYGVRAIGQFTLVSTERLKKVAELADKGIIKVFIDKTFPLEQTKEALDYQQKSHSRGKVVLTIN
ncbi:MAG: L-threonine 3-dehydrogenase [Syntrophus sp. SKADARSKE-3]|nr:L-threonine 3-dehydrogenase [Syntrophus sp. SKADARSKE-3]